MNTWKSWKQGLCLPISSSQSAVSATLQSKVTMAILAAVQFKAQILKLGVHFAEILAVVHLSNSSLLIKDRKF